MIRKENLLYSTMAKFLSMRISANERNTTYITGSLDAAPVGGVPDIMFQSVVFIRDTGQIWTHGSLYGGGISSESLTAEVNARALADVNLDTKITNVADMVAAGKVAFFQGIVSTGTSRAQSSTAESNPGEVYFFEDAGEFGYVPGGISSGSTPRYYPNWGNRDEYEDDVLAVYEDKLYVCIEDETTYIYKDGELVSVGGGNTALSFEVDLETGCLIMIGD